MKKRKTYKIDQCVLYKCNSKKKLEHLLTLEPGQLKFIPQAIQYSRFEIDKKNSDEKRKITAPKFTLKRIQRRILRLVENIKRPDWVIAGTKNLSYIDNGKRHVNSKYALMIDIKKFYDNCHREYVYKFFTEKMKTSPDVAKILTDIVTLNNGIPTGCPTSQLLAYYAYEDMFAKIKAIAEGQGCIFTLYVDDMTFSSSKSFDNNKLKREIELVLRKYNHRPKQPKVKYYSKNAPKPITGTIVTSNNQLKAPNGLQEKVYKGFQKIKVKDISDNPSDTAKNIQTLMGRIQASKNIEGIGKFPEIERLTKTINKKYLQYSNNEFTNKKCNKIKSKIRITK